MKRMLATLMVLSLSLALLAGCGSQGNNAASGSNAGSQSSGSAVQAEELNVGVFYYVFYVPVHRYFLFCKRANETKCFFYILGYTRVCAFFRL